ncbi:MAG TPA: UDP-N-acetylglucosamine 2-epimerase (non-hydrolyzing) [Gemmatimonadales bacterium]|jgi:UDP-N-acetylglucosamine 2-epimerase (non-hydrolysing)|nr:UDP-N-acetylglucosamine 2-epimerase (non-hydrolyzing) [Gemmatimonadales bacterium]
MRGRGQTILSVVGARPNFMKLAPLARQLARRPDVRHVIVHTGQHYDDEMSASFLRTLAIPTPDFNLAAGSASHAQQTATIMQRFEPVCLEARPDVVLVYGDVNSTLAAALVAAKLGIRVGHVEAGLRSRDWSMPEEINRVLTDRLSDLLFTPSRDAGDNLRLEGVPAERVHFVGNIMIDTVVALLPEARPRQGNGGRRSEPYAVVTLHRPANVDDPTTLAVVMDALVELASDRRVLFPVHPRTRARLSEIGWRARTDRLELCDPVSYVEMLSLVLGSELVITDSGGLQEETSFLGVPCVTVRPNTERPITCTEGTNRLVAARRDAICDGARAAIAARRPTPAALERWDGQTAQRITAILCGAETS